MKEKTRMLIEAQRLARIKRQRKALVIILKAEESMLLPDVCISEHTLDRIIEAVEQA